MKLPLADLRVVLPMPPAAALPTGPVQTTHWQLHMQRAESTLALSEPVQIPPRQPEDEATELESCGAPVLIGGPPEASAQRSIAIRPAPAEEPLPPQLAPEREPERSPVRLHVQPLPGEGLQVWLGIDGDAALVAQRASAAVADLRRSLHAAGERIAALVCNGTPVDARASSSAAPAARTPSFPSKDAP
ncbi:MAG TPA: hypothetical protein VFM98_24350 [Ramlibacter sp.]|uniref:hypothetical protein n=1 Tax=Ramlibacter sp. TaxID=1917967 RepID=UPI002D800B81|nr:hypothetical protein [Ramlibacter sp.]HET8748749.1 hypothetical protein [Ramlibacter sp.]